MGPCMASMPQILSQNLAAAPTALNCAARALSKKWACRPSHRVDLLKYTVRSMSAPTPGPGAIAKERMSPGLSQSGGSNTFISAAQMSHGTLPGPHAAATKLRVCEP